MAATLREVAERAGVSVRTVSNVVNDYPHVAPKTRAIVQRALDELGYQPNPLARSLRQGRSGLVGLVIPELDVPYFAELSRAVLHEARALGLTVVVDQTDGELAREREVIVRGQGSAMYDAVIASPVSLTSTDLKARRSTAPLILIGERIAGGGVDHVMVDNVAAAHDATAHLISSGRRRIAAIGESWNRPATTAHLRTEGYRAALTAAGLPVDPELIVATRYLHRADGVQALDRLMSLAQPPDAIFCYNDLLALGVLHAAAHRGVRVPDDLAVVGFDDIEDGRYSRPTLTTISPDRRQIARLAVEMLQRRLDGDTAPAAELRANYQLIVRESSGAAQSAAPRQRPTGGR
ncbi:LacI family DNA-binding transcriptional regulator [Dactylosporangium sp. CA-233914]|uniref:LacI family DNA-binding transcriptional regulator n=1 Tax=Dactylosporangium sp. CA-233914 TaxID=3239934 RepID=UPI003D8E74E2